MSQDQTRKTSFAIYNRQERTSASGKTHKQYVLVFSPGQRGKLAEAALVPPFYIRHQNGDRQWIRLEARSIEDAKAEALQARHEREAVSKGVEVTTAASDDKQRLASRVAEYLLEVEAQKSHSTWLAYRRSMELFEQSCTRLNLADVKREDMLAFKLFLKKQEFEGRSIYNYFLNAMVFLAWANHLVSIKHADWPVKPERDPEEYHEDEILALLNAAENGDRLLLNAFLNSGLRTGEMAHLTYGDIDFHHSLWSVKPKDDHNLKTKESQRAVPVGEWLTKKVMGRKAALGRTDDDLIFPALNGGVDRHLLRIVKRVAKKAGVTGRVDDHKFRSTAITIWLRDGRTIPEVMAFVGHRSPITIMRYAAKAKMSKRENRLLVTKAFDRFSAVGD